MKVAASAGIDCSFYMHDISSLVSQLRSPVIKKRREAAVQLGKSANLSAIPFLIEALTDTHPGVRSDVVQALGRLGDSSAVPALISSLDDPDPIVRAAAIAAIGKIKDRDAVLPLINCLHDKEILIRIGAAEVLGKIGDKRAVGPLKKICDTDIYSEVREAAEAAIKRIQARA
jgi:HEAT repeat protein